MNKTVVSSIALLAAAAVVCFYIYSRTNRYVTANAGDGKIYKIDKQTGQAVLLRGVNEVPVEPTGPPKEETMQEKAIRLAKSAHTIKPDAHYLLDNEFHIRSWIEEQSGNLQIIGWAARQVSEQSWVVTYSFDQGLGIRSWAFEVNMQADLVRNIIGDPVLERKYGFSEGSDERPNKTN